MLIGLVLAAGVLLGPVVALVVAGGAPTPIAFVTRTPSATATMALPTFTPGLTVQPSPTAPPALPSPTYTPSVTWTPSPVPSATAVPVPEGMVLIPAGYFQMGSSTGQRSEAPEHPVLLDAFYLHRFEVSNADYQMCAAAGACTPARLARSFTRLEYRDSPEFAGYPVIGVTWDDAQAYCQWAGLRLPTEAEWEYAASGPENFVWPWGNTFDLARSAAGSRDTQPVDAHPDGASPFGVYNLAGNVEEWVADVYVIDFYAASPPHNPLGDGTGYFRLFRGGSYGDGNRALYTTSRRSVKARNFSNVDLGFRCARSAPEVTEQMPPDARQALVAEFCGQYATYRRGTPCP